MNRMIVGRFNWFLITAIAAYMASSIVVSATRLMAEDKSAADVVVFRGSYPGWPWVAKTPSGKLVCVWREGTAHEYSSEGRLQWSASIDAGMSWSEPATIVDAPEVDDRNVAITCLTETQWLVCYNSYTKDRVSQVWTVRTENAGQSWQTPQLVCDLDARTRSAIVPLSTGEFVLPFYRAPGDQALVGLSVDRGKTWTVVEIANGPGFVGDEWDLVELPDGRLAGIIRNSAPVEKEDDRGWFYLVESRDRGRSWSSARRTNLRDTRSTSPAQIFLHEGRTVVLYSNARMVSVVMATTDDPTLLRWNTDHLFECYHYRSDHAAIQDGSYPVSVALGGRRRLIVDYVHDGDSKTISGYFVELPQAW